MHWLYALIAAGSALFEPGAASTVHPPVLPLTVRNPYLSTWLGDARISPWNKWPMFWTGEEVSRPYADASTIADRECSKIGFGILASVPGTGDVYPLLGRPHDSLMLQEDERSVINASGSDFPH